MAECMAPSDTSGARARRPRFQRARHSDAASARGAAAPARHVASPHARPLSARAMRSPVGSPAGGGMKASPVMRSYRCT